MGWVFRRPARIDDYGACVQRYRGDADAVRAHMFGVCHPSLGAGVAEHVRKSHHPVLVAVAGEHQQCCYPKVDFALVVDTSQSVPFDRRLNCAAIEAGDLDVKAPQIVHIVQRHGLVDRYPYEHRLVPQPPALGVADAAHRFVCTRRALPY
jgi:hypothetical protein